MELPALVAEATGLTGNVASASARLPGLVVEAGSDRLQMDADIDLPSLIARATAVGGENDPGRRRHPCASGRSPCVLSAQLRTSTRRFRRWFAEASGFADLIADAEVDLPAFGMCGLDADPRTVSTGLVLRYIQIHRISAVADLDTESVFTEWPPAMP